MQVNYGCLHKIGSYGIMGGIQRTMNRSGRLLKSRFLHGIALFALILAVGLFSRSRIASESAALSPVSQKTSIVFVSDTQALLFLETLRLKRTHNEEATKKIMERISQESTAAAVFHLGDVTAVGSSDRKWARWDDAHAKLKKLGIAVYAVMGNHDYMWSPEKGRANFAARFPESNPSWYAVRIPPLAVIGLNSNFHQLSPAERAEQKRFYEAEMKALETDPAVRNVIVCCHHAPYTNSRIVSPSEDVVKEFVPLFMESGKSRLFLSGHAHAAEHFMKGGKHFLVLGGGGGLLHPLLTGRKQKYEDLFPLKTKIRFFHYVELQFDEGQMTIVYRMLARDLADFTDVLQFSIPFD